MSRRGSGLDRNPTSCPSIIPCGEGYHSRLGNAEGIRSTSSEASRGASDVIGTSQGEDEAPSTDGARNIFLVCGLHHLKVRRNSDWYGLVYSE